MERHTSALHEGRFGGPDHFRPGFRRRLIVAHPDPGFVRRVCGQFRQLGWEVRPAQDSDDVRRLARDWPSAVVILSTNLVDESGWLVCAKLIAEHPDQKVILVDANPAPAHLRFSDFVGGTALVDEDLRSVMNAIHSAELPAAG